jgi:cold-inducible RNA-binding protein
MHERGLDDNFEIVAKFLATFSGNGKAGQLDPDSPQGQRPSPTMPLAHPLPFFLTSVTNHETASARCGAGGNGLLSRRPVVAKKLYVGNLSFGTTDSDLRTMFEEFGSVESAQVIMDRETGRSKGFGFVEMGGQQEAEAAIKAMNGKDMDGRALTVNEAKPREDRGGRSGGGGRGGYGGGRR